MKQKNFLLKRFFLILLIMILLFATIFPNVFGNPLYDLNNTQDKLSKSTHTLGGFLRNSLFRLFSNRPRPNGIFSSSFITNCNGNEKITEIILTQPVEIDIDDNPDTGVNGKDVSVNYLILPWIRFDNDIGFGLTFTFYLERIGEELKNSDFSASLKIAQNTINLGFRSPAEIGNEIPSSIQISFNIFFYLLKRTRGFGVEIDPEYFSVDKGNIELFAEYNGEDTQKEFQILFEPAIKTEIGIISTKRQGVWTYDFIRQASEDSKITTTYRSSGNGESEDVTFSVDKIPNELRFSMGITPLAFGGGQLLYESSDTYDIELQVNSADLGTCGYSYIKNTPRRVFAEWTPTFTNGNFYVEMESEGTDFIVRDSLDNPYINLEVRSLKTIDVDTYWNLTNPGDFTVYKDTDIHIDLDFTIGDWIAKIDAEPVAKNISTSWFIDVTGYLTIDTDWEPFSTIDLTIKGPLVGAHISGDSFKSQDLDISWTLWPPQEWDLVITGYVDASEITSIDLYLINNWYHLWPW
jgi:hypothetical protein